MIILGIKTIDIQKINVAVESVYSEQKYRVVSNLTYLNEGWTAVLVDDSDSRMDDLDVQKLSQELAVDIVGFEALEKISYYKVVRYCNGQFEDEWEIVDFEVVEKSGYFDNLGDILKSEDEIDTALSSFFKEVGFEPRTAEILRSAQ